MSNEQDPILKELNKEVEEEETTEETPINKDDLIMKKLQEMDEKIEKATKKKTVIKTQKKEEKKEEKNEEEKDPKKNCPKCGSDKLIKDSRRPIYGCTNCRFRYGVRDE